MLTVDLSLEVVFGVAAEGTYKKCGGRRGETGFEGEVRGVFLRRVEGKACAVLEIRAMGLDQALARQSVVQGVQVLSRGESIGIEIEVHTLRRKGLAPTTVLEGGGII